jgi:hypothetical protein
MIPVIVQALMRLARMTVIILRLTLVGLINIRHSFVPGKGCPRDA